MSFEADQYGADALAAQLEAAAGPLEAAMRSDAIQIGTGGRIRLDAGAWEPMIQIAPLRDLEEEELVVSATLAGNPLAPLRFERMTEKGSWLVLHVPPTSNRRTAAAVEIVLSARLSGTSLTLKQLRELVAVRAVEGLFARLLHVTTSEARQLRRQARLVHAAATLDGARGFVLDRYGQELAVPRLTDRLEMRSNEIVTVPAAESDADYRRRLRLYRQWFSAGRKAIGEALNGTASTPGPLQEIGAPATFTIDETDNPLFSAIRIVSVAATSAAASSQLSRFLGYLRDTILIDPAVNVPAARALSSAARTRENALRMRLRNGLSFADPAKRAMAPYLAAAFDQLVGFIAALGGGASVQVLRAQDDGGGTRHELGLGAEIAALPTTALAAIRTALAAPLPAGLSHTNRSIAAALRGKDLSASSGAWLLAACGFRTVEPSGGGRLFVSHLPIGGVTITGPSTAVLSGGTASPPLRFAASMIADADGLGMALKHALGGGTPGWPSGDPPWTLVTPAQLGTTLDTLTALGGPTSAAIAPSRVAAIPAADIARFVEATKRYPAGTVAALSLDSTFAAALAAGTTSAIARWDRLIETLGSNGAASAALFARASGAPVLVVSAHGLPLVGSNIGPRRTTGYFWDCLPASAGASGAVTPAGTEARLRPDAPGIYAVHCLASARIGDTDPYEYRVGLPAGASINLTQYEMLMNILTRAYPVGIEVNTWALRRSHVQLSSGNITPLDPSQSRAFRRWRKPHFAGVNLNRPDFTS